MTAEFYPNNLMWVGKLQTLDLFVFLSILQPMNLLLSPGLSKADPNANIRHWPEQTKGQACLQIKVICDTGHLCACQ